MSLQRNGTIDALRFGAAAAIVWFHAGAPLASIAYAGLPLFTMLFARFAVPAAADRTAALVRAATLLRLWVVWSVVFIALKSLDAIADGRAISTEFAPWMLLAGPSVHLWFLPFAAVLVLVGHGAASLLAAGPDRAAGTSVAALGLGIAAIWLAARARYGIPADQWLSMVPAAALGVVLTASPARARLVPFAVLLAVFAVYLVAAGAPMRALTLLVAAALVAGAMLRVSPSSQATLALRDISLGVYLVHPAVMAALMRLPGLAENRTLLGVLSIIGATLAAIVLLDARLARYLSLPRIGSALPVAGLTVARKPTMIPANEAPEQKRDTG